jgi:hypothetical protein
MGLGSMGRDEGLVSFLFRLALNVLMNFTLGLLGATVAFIWYLWDVIKSYQPDPFTGICVCVCVCVCTHTHTHTHTRG